jgi:hypothetical protein
MAIEIKHATVAVGTNAGNGEIAKQQWNESHAINMASNKLLGRSTAGTGVAEEISIGNGLSLATGTLSVTLTGGDVVGPASATENNLAAFDGITGKLIKEALTVTIAQGGTGQTTAQAAINSLAGATTSAQFLRGNGTNVVMSGIQVSDVPTLNQSTTGTAGQVANAVTFNTTGGAASGTTFNGSAARTIDYSTVGAPKADGTGASGTWDISVTGNAGTATTLQTARTINGVSFNGSANITVADATKLPLAGGTMTGAITFDSAQTWPTFNQNTTGTASNVTGTVAIANGGTGQTTAQTAINALAGAVTDGRFLRGNGTNVLMAIIQASDVPNLDASKITTGVIEAARLPSYVDDVLEFANLASFPVTGETGKIYIALDTNKVYRWSGSVYVYITSGAVDSVAGKTGVVTLVKADVGLSNVDNTSDANKEVLSATKLTTARTINGTSFDGTANITIADATKLPLTGGTMTGAITFDNAQTWPTFNQNTTGTAANVTGTVAVLNGGTGQTTYTDGQLLIGNTTGNTLSKATLTAGSNITITNGAGTITIASTGGGGGGGATTYTGTAAAASWTGSGPYTQTVTVTGVASGDTVILDLDLSSAAFADVTNLQFAYAQLYRAVPGTNTMTLYATAVPSYTFDIYATVV